MCLKHLFRYPILIANRGSNYSLISRFHDKKQMLSSQMRLLKEFFLQTSGQAEELGPSHLLGLGRSRVAGLGAVEVGHGTRLAQQRRLAVAPEERVQQRHAIAGRTLALRRQRIVKSDRVKAQWDRSSYGISRRSHVDVQPHAREVEAKVGVDKEPRARRLSVRAILWVGKGL